MIVYRCDRCKKEFKSMLSLTQVNTGTLFKSYYDLCDSCTKEMHRFLNSSKKDQVGDIK